MEVILQTIGSLKIGETFVLFELNGNQNNHFDFLICEQHKLLFFEGKKAISTRLDDNNCTNVFWHKNLLCYPIERNQRFIKSTALKRIKDVQEKIGKSRRTNLLLGNLDVGNRFYKDPFSEEMFYIMNEINELTYLCTSFKTGGISILKNTPVWIQ